MSEINDPDLLFTERAVGLRKHAGQISFPGGTYEPGDADAPATALRETWEEVGLQPDKVTLLGRLPVTGLPVSSFDVAPVVGSWSGLDPMAVTSPAEVATHPSLADLGADRSRQSRDGPSPRRAHRASLAVR